VFCSLTRVFRSAFLVSPPLRYASSSKSDSHRFTLQSPLCGLDSRGPPAEAKGEQFFDHFRAYPAISSSLVISVAVLASLRSTSVVSRTNRVPSQTLRAIDPGEVPLAQVVRHCKARMVMLGLQNGRSTGCLTRLRFVKHALPGTSQGPSKTGWVKCATWAPMWRGRARLPACPSRKRIRFCRCAL